MRKVLIIAGPTASGKTGYAVERAKSVDGEVINCDSLQIYDSLKILTAVPKNKDLDGVVHKLFCYLTYNRKSSVVDWAHLASVEIEKTISSGKVPIIVGGTGLYINVLVNGISPMPEISNNIRANVLGMNYGEVCDALYKQDPRLKSVITSDKHHQVIRAYEIFLETGMSILDFRNMPKKTFMDNVTYEYEIMKYDRQELYERINGRFDEMLKNGAINEVENLLHQINNPNRQEIFATYPIFNAIGAKEIVMYIDGMYSASEMIEKSKINSRRYAKRQITWLANQKIC
ncbi:MAG: tRNA (adenosine(37)-N6)-dimethylallyltransferase MiaA [Holosporales bacterium]|jgi:tRNA dimethylallyltransferase|nr:tRNA (adenosine(37)-N6)-dimethylallyltransferase MiaA [Holosporales bacterium]